MLGVAWFAEELKAAATTAMTLLTIAGALCVALLCFRNRIFEKLKLHTDSTLEGIVEPVKQISQSIMDRNSDDVVDGASELARRVLSRYVWMTSRRWMLNVIGGLLVTVAALSGSALLVKQNELLESQTVVLTQQDNKIQEQITLLISQNALISEQNLLTEANRRATLNFEVTAILDAINAEIDSLAQLVPDPSSPPEGFEQYVVAVNDVFELDAEGIVGIRTQHVYSRPYWVQLRNPASVSATPPGFQVVLSQRLIGRVAALSRALKPYRYVDVDGQMVGPLSPERAQLAMSLHAAGVALPPLAPHMIFDYADFRGMDLVNFSFARMRLEHADFAGATLLKCEFRESWLQDCSFEGTEIGAVDFRFAYLPEPGAFRGAQITGTHFENAIVPSHDWVVSLMALAKINVDVEDLLPGLRASEKRPGGYGMVGPAIVSHILPYRNVEHTGFVLHMGADPLSPLESAPPAVPK